MRSAHPQLLPEALAMANRLTYSTGLDVLPVTGPGDPLQISARRRHALINVDGLFGDFLAALVTAYAIHEVGVSIVDLLNRPVLLSGSPAPVTSLPMTQHSIGDLYRGA